MEHFLKEKLLWVPTEGQTNLMTTGIAFYTPCSPSFVFVISHPLASYHSLQLGRLTQASSQAHYLFTLILMQRYLEEPLIILLHIHEHTNIHDWML